MHIAKEASDTAKKIIIKTTNAPASFDKEHDATRFLNGVNKRAKILETLECTCIGSSRFIPHDFLLVSFNTSINFCFRSVGNRDIETLLSHIQGKILSHDTQTVQSHISHIYFLFCWCVRGILRY
jgi:hypothetical protein